MIQLDLSRAQMLTEIEAPRDEGALSALALGDPAFLRLAPARLSFRAHHRREFFPLLELVLRRRFRKVTSAHLERDLLTPLKNAIGNAYRRGNLEDLSKWFTVDVTATDHGAVLAVTDEGSGFDVAGVLGRFRKHERYYTRGGHGTVCFEETPSLVAYADGGRTWLLRFLADPEPGRPLAPSESASGPAADSTFMRAYLAERVDCFHEHGVALDSCRIYALAGGEHGAHEFGYVVRAHPRDRAPKAMVLTGRVLTAAAAQADVMVAERLRADRRMTAGGLHVPRPLGAFQEPGLALFQLDPSSTLRERAKELRELAPFTRILALVGAGLARLHASELRFLPVETLADVVERQARARRRVEAELAGKPCAERARACFDLLLARASTLQPCAPVPIHGALEWDCIVGSDESWSLYRFDGCRLSHPGLDVGTFLADLLRFHVLRCDGDARLCAAGRFVFLGSYFGALPPPWARDLGWFVAAALLGRLERMFRREESCWLPKVEPLLEQVERALGRS